MVGSFLRVECPDCGNEQIVFDRAATVVNGAVCGSTLAEPTSGKASLSGEVVDVVEAR